MDEQERQQKCDQARRDRDAASSQISVLDGEIAVQRQRAADAAEEASRAEEHLSIAARASTEAEADGQRAVEAKQAAASRRDDAQEAKSEAEAELAESKSEIQWTGAETSWDEGTSRARNAEYDAAIADVLGAQEEIQRLRAVRDAAEERIPGYQAQISERRNTESSANAQGGALSEERQRRSSELSDAEGRIAEYCG